MFCSYYSHTYQYRTHNDHQSWPFSVCFLTICSIISSIKFDKKKKWKQSDLSFPACNIQEKEKGSKYSHWLFEVFRIIITSWNGLHFNIGQKKFLQQTATCKEFNPVKKSYHVLSHLDLVLGYCCNYSSYIMITSLVQSHTSHWQWTPPQLPDCSQHITPHQHIQPQDVYSGFGSQHRISWIQTFYHW